MDVYQLLPPLERLFCYDGSLTTPPCTGSVRWVVMAAPQQIGPEQLAELETHLHGNRWPVQPLEARKILCLPAERNRAP